MAFEVKPAVDSDFPHIAAQTFISLSEPINGVPDDVVMATFFPRMDTEKGWNMGINRLREKCRKTADEPDRYAKVVRVGSDETALGMLAWSMSERPVRPTTDWLKRSYFETQEEYDFAIALAEGQSDIVWNLVKDVDQPLFELELFAMGPSYQRQGAGSVLIKYVLNKADAVDGVTFVHASRKAVEFYKKHGFVEMHRAHPKLDPKWAHKKLMDDIVLVRQPQTIQA